MQFTSTPNASTISADRNGTKEDASSFRTLIKQEIFSFFHLNYEKKKVNIAS